MYSNKYDTTKDHCILMNPIKLYPQYDYYRGDVDLECDNLPSHKRVILTIGFAVFSITVAIITMQYFQCKCYN